MQLLLVSHRLTHFGGLLASVIVLNTESMYRIPGGQYRDDRLLLSVLYALVMVSLYIKKKSNSGPISGYLVATTVMTGFSYPLSTHW